MVHHRALGVGLSCPEDISNFFVFILNAKGRMFRIVSSSFKTAVMSSAHLLYYLHTWRDREVIRFHLLRPFRSPSRGDTRPHRNRCPPPPFDPSPLAHMPRQWACPERTSGSASRVQPGAHRSPPSAGKRGVRCGREHKYKWGRSEAKGLVAAEYRMSCAQVMYHPYSSYFPYQRPVASAAAASPTAAAAASSSGQVPQQQQPSTAEPKKFAVPKMHETLAESGECSVASQSPASLPKEKDKGTHYVSANCVVFTYYSGDISAVVDEHFTRALSQPSSYSPEPGKTPAKDVPPMSQRNFPPSFWNSNYQPSAAGLSGLGAVPATPHSDMPYPAEAYHSGALHTIHQGDPWHYTLSPHAQATGPYTHRPSVHELSYSGMPSSRFSPQYGSLLLQPSVRAARLPTCTGLDKGDTWGTSRYHEPLSHVDTNYGATYGTMGTIPGLESQVQEPSKDLYWF